MICLGARKSRQGGIILAKSTKKSARRVPRRSLSKQYDRVKTKENSFGIRNAEAAWVRSSNNIASGICFAFSSNSDQTNVFHTFTNSFFQSLTTLFFIRCHFWSQLRGSFEVLSEMAPFCKCIYWVWQQPCLCPFQELQMELCIGSALLARPLSASSLSLRWGHIGFISSKLFFLFEPQMASSHFGFTLY